jgi:hypothetical protein
MTRKRDELSVFGLKELGGEVIRASESAISKA